MAITLTIDFNEAFVVATSGERAVGQFNFGDKLFGVPRMPDADSPGLPVGLRADNANIAAQIDEAVTRAKIKAYFRGAIGCIFLSKAAEIELHTGFSEVKLAVREGYIVETNERQYCVDRCLIGQM